VVKVDAVSGGEAPFTTAPAFTVDNVVGEVKFNASQTGAEIKQDVRVARLNLSAVGATGDSALAFTLITLRDKANGQIAPAAGVNSPVTVAQAIVKVDSVIFPLGSAATVPMTVDFAPKGGLAGYNVSIAYDPAAVKIDAILPGDPPFGGSPISHIDGTGGFVNIVGFHGNRPGPTGKLVVLRISLTGVREGTSPLKVTVKDLVDAVDAASWPAVASHGTARVVLASAFVAPPTPVIATPPAPAATPRPLPEAIRANVSPQIGVEIASPNGEISVRIPAGAVTKPGFVKMQLIPSEAAPRPPSGAGLRTAVEINLLDSDGKPLDDVLLAKEVTIAMRFTSSDLRSAGEAAIIIQRYEPLLGLWTQLPTIVDATNTVATTTVKRLSIFGLIVGQASTTTATSPTAPTAASPTAPTAASPAVPTAASPAVAGPTPTPLPTVEASSGGGISVAIVVLIAIVAVAVLGVAGYAVYRVTR
jgi:hypothetical protein